ncbi:gpi anchored [Fusarium beomiforme]|uniref:Gpi anchored n=1 Tax=Fusarium beomiforme TaxID=44412 RepID=A0A9P5AV20_9HYPO|nr:gpi anchored [Fusarium beomiforme]
MRSISTVLLSLTTLLPLQTHAESGSPIAIRKVAPGSNDKLLREHLAFAPLPILSAREAAAAAISILDEQDDELLGFNSTGRFYRPAFAPHSDESREGLLRRAAEALALLQRSAVKRERIAWMSEMLWREASRAVLTAHLAVEELEHALMELRAAQQSLAEVAVFRDTFVKDLASGVPSAVATQTRTTQSTTQDQTTILTSAQETSTENPTVESTTETETEVETTAGPTTASETETTVKSETEDSTVIATATATGSATGIAPYRPTGTSVTSSNSGETQTGCPTGFYGCLATHGGGCCRTGRNCDVHDCPAPSTTIVSDGATVVILATDAPPAPGPSSTCAEGWFLCGRDAGPVAGCCPNGYDCGTASCFTAQASETGRVQKEFPKADAARHEKPAITMVMVGVFACFVLV